MRKRKQKRVRKKEQGETASTSCGSGKKRSRSSSSSTQNAECKVTCAIATRACHLSINAKNNTESNENSEWSIVECGGTDVAALLGFALQIHTATIYASKFVCVCVCVFYEVCMQQRGDSCLQRQLASRHLQKGKNTAKWLPVRGAARDRGGASNGQSTSQWDGVGHANEIVAVAMPVVGAVALTPKPVRQLLSFLLLKCIFFSFCLLFSTCSSACLTCHLLAIFSLRRIAALPPCRAAWCMLNARIFTMG